MLIIKKFYNSSYKFFFLLPRTDFNLKRETKTHGCKMLFLEASLFDILTDENF